MKIVFDSVELVRDRWRVAKTLTADDGSSERQLHVFPTDTMEWRAAEYGIDPSDTASLLDVVLTEPHLTPEDWANGSALHTAPDIATARRDHLARCAAVKLRHRMSTRAKGTPLDRVRAESVMDLEVVAVKTAHVSQVREQQLAHRRRLSLAPVPRAEVLRRQLLGPEPIISAAYPDASEES
jgi:hypothetical protein